MAISFKIQILGGHKHIIVYMLKIWRYVKEEITEVKVVKEE